MKGDGIGEELVREERWGYVGREELVIIDGSLSRSIIMDFDVEEMRGVVVDELFVFGSRVEFMLEIRSFCESLLNGDMVSYGSYGEEV